MVKPSPTSSGGGATATSGYYPTQWGIAYNSDGYGTAGRPSSTVAPAPAPDIDRDTTLNNHGTVLGNGQQVSQSDRTRGARSNAPSAKTNKPLNALTETNFPYGMDAFGLRRGAIVQVKTDASTGAPIPKSQRYVFRFLFNPDNVAFGNQSLASVLDPGSRNPLDNGSILMTGVETVGFSLLLDRTQEAYNEGLSTRGTLDDVEMLYKVINGDIGSAAGFLSLSAVEIQWGPTGQNGHPLPPFPCYITNITVTHTQFTPRMCPIRTALTINATRLINPVTGVTASGIQQVGGGS